MYTTTYYQLLLSDINTLYTINCILYTLKLYEHRLNILFINYDIVGNRIFLILCKKLKKKIIGH